MGSKKLLLVAASLANTLIVSGCVGNVGSIAAGNGAAQSNGSADAKPGSVVSNPVIQAFTANPTNLSTPGGTITFSVDAADPDKGLLSFRWSATGGALSTTAGKVVSWTAPTAPGTYTIQVAIINAKGGTTEAAQNITVNTSGTGTIAAAPVIAAPPATTTTTVTNPQGTTTTTTTGTQTPQPVTQIPTPQAPGPQTQTSVSFGGMVMDDFGSRLDGVTVTAKALSGTFSNGTDTVQATTQIGSYLINGAPPGANIQITATKLGFTTRQMTIVTQQVGQPDPAKPVLVISDKPEILNVGIGGTGNTGLSSFTLTFSEPVNTADVESNFAIWVAGNGGGSYALTVGANLPVTYVIGTDTVTSPTSPIYDSASFTTGTWSNNNQTVTLTFRPGALLPMDKDPAKVPQYALSFKNGSIRDAAGTGRSGGMFHLNQAVQGNTNGMTFAGLADATAPRVTSITAINKDESASNTTDRIRVQFSKTMALFPGNNGGISIPASTTAGYAALNTNFRYFVSPSGSTTLPDGTFTRPGGFPGSGFTPSGARFYDGDATRQTFEIIPLSGTAGNDNGFTTGHNIWVYVNPVVIDPAGNALDASNNTNTGSGVAQ